MRAAADELRAALLHDRRGADAVHVQLDVPTGFTRAAAAPAAAADGQRIAAVTVNGKPWYAFAGPETIDLSGLTGHVDLVAVRR